MFAKILLLVPAFLAATQAVPLVERTTYTTNFTAEIATNTCSSPGYAIPGTISTDTGCINLSASSYLIGELPDVACQFTLYNGWGCPAGAVNAVTDVPAGSDSVCAFAGVYDGGACSYCVKRSATYTCA